MASADRGQRCPSNHNSYLVVWSADDDSFESWDQGDEIHMRVVKVIAGTTDRYVYGQRIDDSFFGNESGNTLLWSAAVPGS